MKDLIYLGILLKSESAIFMLLWFFLPILIFTISTRNTSVRYIMPFLPLATIIAAYGLTSLRKFKIQTFLLTISFPLIFSLLLIYSPLKFYNYLNIFTKYTDYNHFESWTSGYGISETINYLEKKSDNQKIVILVRSDSGNPEDAMFVYFKNNKNMNIDYLEKDYCKKGNLSFRNSIYFIARDYNLEGNESCLKEEKRFFKPDGVSSIGVYKVVN